MTVFQNGTDDCVKCSTKIMTQSILTCDRENITFFFGNVCHAHGTGAKNKNNTFTVENIIIANC